MMRQMKRKADARYVCKRNADAGGFGGCSNHHKFRATSTKPSAVAWILGATGLQLVPLPVV